MPVAPGLPAWGGRYAQRLTAACLSTYGTTCHLCLRPGATTADHLIPRDDGGLDDLDNLRPAHHRCNSRRQKRALTALLFAEFRRDSRVDGRGAFTGWAP